MPTLSKPCKCAACYEPMAVGEAFRWYEKSAIQGGSRVRGVPSRTIPAHADVDVCWRNRNADRLANKAAQTATVARLTALAQSGATAEQLLAALVS